MRRIDWFTKDYRLHFMAGKSHEMAWHTIYIRFKSRSHVAFNFIRWWFFFAWDWPWVK